MSTKIFNAYLFDGTKAELLDYLKIYSNEDSNRKALINKMFKYEIKMYINDLITSTKGSVEKLGNLIAEAKLSYLFDADDFSQEYRENPEQSVVVYDTSKTKVSSKQLLQVFLDNNSDLAKDIANNKKFKEFDYTNASDMDISRKEEKLRENTWDIIFQGSAVPGAVGDTYCIYDFLNDYASNSFLVKKEIGVVMNNIYQKNKTEKELENSLSTIEINLRCQEIRRKEKNESDLNDNEDYGGSSEFMRIYRQANKEKDAGVALPATLQKKLDNFKIVAKFLPEELPSGILDSAIERLNVVIEKTQKRKERMLESYKKYNLESEISKPYIKL